MNKQHRKEPREGGLKYATKFACKKREKNLITGFFIFLRFFVCSHNSELHWAVKEIN